MLIIGGDVGFAVFATETATIDTIKQRAGTVTLGDGVQLDTLYDKSGGELFAEEVTVAGTLTLR